MLDGMLTTVPLPAGVQRILDVGTGPGDWAVAMAAEFPDAEIVATDLAVWDVESVESAALEALEGDDMGEVVWEIDDLDLWGPVIPPEMQAEHRIREETAMPGLDIVAALENLQVEDKSSLRQSDHSGDDSGIGTSEPSPSISAMPTSQSPSHDVEGNAKGKGKQRYTEAEESKPSSSSSKARQAASQSMPSASPTAPLHWSYTQPFDFIHVRGMKGAFANWPALYREIYHHLKPGGWCEIIDFDMVPLPHLASASFTHLFLAVKNAAARNGYPITTAHINKAMLQSAGFEEVAIRTEVVPLGTWPDDERERMLGKMWFVAVVESAEATGMRILRREGWSEEKVKRELKRAVREITRGELGELKTEFKFLRGRKPRRS
jgi:SAM-dependent methyltransferase